MGSPVTDGGIAVPLASTINEVGGVLNDGGTQNGNHFPFVGAIDPRDSSKSPLARDDTLNGASAWSVPPTGLALDSGGAGFSGMQGSILNALRAIKTAVQGTLATSSADGQNATIGTTTDTAYSSGTGTVVAVLKGIFTRLGGTLVSNVSTTPQVPSTIGGTAYSGTAINSANAADNPIVFAGPSTNRRLKICNNTSATITLSLTGAAGVGSFQIGPGGQIIEDTVGNTIHLYTPSVVPLGGSASGNVFIEGGY